MIKLDRPVCPEPEKLKTNYKEEKNKEALRNASHGNCMYCESKTDHVYFGDIEHIIPKDHRPDLKFDWNNLGYSCAICNNNKRNTYDSGCPIVNPYDEEPRAHLTTLGYHLYSVNGSERGSKTIIDTGLNRPELLQKRFDQVKHLHSLVDNFHKTKNPMLKESVRTIIKSQTQKEFQLLSVNVVNELDSTILD